MKENITISISTESIIKVLFWVCIFMGIFYVSDFLIALLVAVVLASATEPFVRWASKYNVPRWASVSSVFLFLIFIIGSILFIFIPPLADDLARFISSLPKILESIRIFGRDMGFKDLATSINELSKSISKGQILSILQNAFFGSAGFFATTSVLLSGVVNVVLTFVLAFYLALEERGVNKFLRLVVPNRHEDYVEDLWYRSQNKISLWMQGQLLLSFLVSLLVYIPNLILGLPYAALIAILAFIGELIPMVGLTLAMVPALFIAWTHGGANLLLIVAVIYFIISQLESHVLYPKVMNKMVGVPSVVVIISMVIGAKIAGIWGVILAVPLASVIMELVGDVEKKKPHGN